MLLEKGIDISKRIFQVEVVCFICDRPARAFMKGIKGHTGYHACERCVIKSCRYEIRTLYPFAESEKRTDDSFRRQDDSLHHTYTSPLISIQPPVDMVKQFVLDFMHLGYLGVMKKLLNDYWLNTAKSFLTRESILRISQRMMNLSHQIPSEFQRTTRSLGDISKWKATEYRMFLLYYGPYVLEDILPENIYKHFLLLHVACRILLCDELWRKYLPIARKYLERFVL